MIKRTTLWELIMKQFSPDFFIDLAAILGHTTGMNIGVGIIAKDESDRFLKQEIREDTRKDLKKLLTRSEQECLRLNLSMSAKTISKLLPKLSKSTITYEEVSSPFLELEGRLIDEMESMVFFSIEPDRQELLAGDLFGKQVAEAFPSAEQDIKHAGKCLAFEEWTASVFHSMRVLEIGLSVLAKDVGITKIDYRNWESLIHEVETNIKTASGGDKVKEQFYSEAALQFRYFKNAWRNHVMHVRDTYDEERAETIFGHVREFMVHLATKLKDDAP